MIYPIHIAIMVAVFFVALVYVGTYTEVGAGEAAVLALTATIIISFMIFLSWVVVCHRETWWGPML